MLNMVAERLLKDDPYDGANKSWEDLEFDMNNVLTYSSLSGGRKEEREAAAAVKFLLDEVRTMDRRQQERWYNSNQRTSRWHTRQHVNCCMRRWHCVRREEQSSSSRRR